MRFDAQTFDGFHGYDLDFSYRVSAAGLACGICLDLTVFHESNGISAKLPSLRKAIHSEISEAANADIGDIRMSGVRLGTRDELLSLHRWMARWVSMSDEELLARVLEGAL